MLLDDSIQSWINCFGKFGDLTHKMPGIVDFSGVLHILTCIWQQSYRLKTLILREVR